MHRLRGELLLMGPGRVTEAEACFLRSPGRPRAERPIVGTARRDEPGKLLVGEAKAQEARDLVQETYGWFGEGLGTGDQREAQA